MNSFVKYIEIYIATLKAILKEHKEEICQKGFIPYKIINSSNIGERTYRGVEKVLTIRYHKLIVNDLDEGYAATFVANINLSNGINLNFHFDETDTAKSINWKIKSKLGYSIEDHKRTLNILEKAMKEMEG